MPDTNHPYTRLCYWGLALILVVLVVAFPPANVLCYDVFGYYMYLPLGFKYHDLTIQNQEQLTSLLHHYHASETFYQALRWENGNMVMRYPIGLAVLYAPFYFIGDLAAHLTGQPADGFSRPYQLSVLYGCLIYTLIGLHFLRKVLVHFFSDKAAALTLLGIGLGTNYFFHVSSHGQGAMSHNLLFSLYAAIVYLTIRWHTSFRMRDMLLLGICCGLTALCRASEIICVVIPLLYGISNVASFKQKVHLLWAYKGQVVVFAFVVMAVGFIQLGYYKYASGHFVINPYGAGNPGEGLEFLHPHILEVLFSFRKGWFIYTPLMLFVVLGFHGLYRRNRDLFLPVLVFGLLSLYIVASWSCWWFGTCFGNRGLIACYAVLSLPLGYFFEDVLQRKVRYLVLPVFVLFIALNLFQTWQVRESILDATNVSRAYYFSMFLQTKPASHEQNKLLLQGRFSSGVDVFTEDNARTHYLNAYRLVSFESDTLADRLLLCDTLGHSGHRSLITTSVTPASPPYDLEAVYGDLTTKTYTWIKASMWVYSTLPADSLNESRFQIYMRHKGWEFKPVDYKLNAENFRPNTWNRLEYFYLTPDDLRSTKDKVGIRFINYSAHPIFIDDMLIESYEPIIDQSVF